jgi:hypothetical protein
MSFLLHQGTARCIDATTTSLRFIEGTGYAKVRGTGPQARATGKEVRRPIPHRLRCDPRANGVAGGSEETDWLCIGDSKEVIPVREPRPQRAPAHSRVPGRPREAALSTRSAR